MNGKGDRNRSLSKAYRDGWERIFGEPELSESQKFAIALQAGVPISSKVENGQLTLTTEPCAITQVNGQVRVIRKAKD